MHVIAYRRSALTVFCTFVPGVPISFDLGHQDSIPMSRPLPVDPAPYEARSRSTILVADRQSSRPRRKLLWSLSMVQGRHLVQIGRFTRTRHMHGVYGSALYRHLAMMDQRTTSTYPLILLL